MRYTRISTVKGMVLIEVMIASSLALLLIAALTACYLTLHLNLQKHQRLQRQQMTAEKVIAVLNAEVSMAGHIGCAALSNDFSVATHDKQTINAQTSIEVARDRLIVRYQALPTNLLLRPSRASSLEVDNSVVVRPKEWVIISDCHQAEIIYVEAVSYYHHKQIVKTLMPLAHTYQPNAELGRLVMHDYRLRAVKNHFNLIRVDIKGRSSTIAEDIESLHFLRDDHGVHVDFITRDGDQKNQWETYAVHN